MNSKSHVSGFQLHFFSFKNHIYKNGEAQNTPKFENVVVISLVVISISFSGSDLFYWSLLKKIECNSSHDRLNGFYVCNI